MIATLPHYKSSKPLGAIQGMFAIAVILTPALIKIHFEQRTRAAQAVEYQSNRPFILSRIETAAKDHDLDTLVQLNHQYAGRVADSTLTSTLHTALAKVIARETEIELTVSKHLDMARHREEVKFPHDSLPSKPSQQGVETQSLSVLPH